MDRTPQQPPSTSTPTAIEFTELYRQGAARRIQGDADLVKDGHTTIGDDCRRTLLIHPPAALSFELSPVAARLSFGIGIDPEVWAQPEMGATEFLVLDGNRLVFRQSLDVRAQHSDRRWHDISIDLPRAEGQRRILTLATAAPAHDFRWALFSEPVWTERPAEFRSIKILETDGTITKLHTVRSGGHRPPRSAGDLASL